MDNIEILTRKILIEKDYLVPVKVIVFKTSEKSYWYKDFIGDSFCVRNFKNYKEFEKFFGVSNKYYEKNYMNYYFVLNIDNTDNGFRIIGKEDCVIIK